MHLITALGFNVVTLAFHEIPKAMGIILTHKNLWFSKVLNN